MRWHEVEVRQVLGEGDELPWKRLEQRFAESVASIDVPGLIPGATYQLRVRTFDDVDGRASDWTILGSITARTALGDPVPPEELRMTCGECLAWDMPHDVADVEGFEIRHAPELHPTFETAEPVGPGVVAAAPLALCAVPRGRRTFFIRTRLKDGSVSSAPASITVDRGPLDDASEFTLRTVDERALGWTGQKQGGAIVSGDYVASAAAASPDLTPAWPGDLEPAWSVLADAPHWLHADAPAWSPVWGDNAPFWREDPNSDPWAVPWRWLEYVWTFTVHAGEDGPDTALTLDLGVTGTGWRIQYRRRGLAPAPWWGRAEAPAWGADTDDPWPSVVEPFRPWPGRLEAPAVGEYQFRLIVPGGRNERPSIQRAVTRLSAARREEVVSALAVPATTTRAVPSAPFRRIMAVEPIHVGADTQTRGAVVSVNRTKGPVVAAMRGAVNSAADELTVRLIGHGTVEA